MLNLDSLPSDEVMKKLAADPDMFAVKVISL
jgi:hypothetical protein